MRIFTMWRKLNVNNSLRCHYVKKEYLTQFEFFAMWMLQESCNSKQTDCGQLSKRNMASCWPSLMSWQGLSVLIVVLRDLQPMTKLQVLLHMAFIRPLHMKLPPILRLRHIARTQILSTMAIIILHSISFPASYPPQPMVHHQLLLLMATFHPLLMKLPPLFLLRLQKFIARGYRQ